MKTGGPAFPRPYFENANGTEWSPSQDGMTLRAYIATKAMAGLLAGNAVYNGRSDDRAALARDAVAHADALIAELEKNGGGA
jgi:hypothetical protein